MTQLARPSAIPLWQRPEWPYFQWDSSLLFDALVQLRHQQGRLLAGVLSREVPSRKPLTQVGLCEWAGGSFRQLGSPAQIPAMQLNDEIQKFLAWWNEPPVGLDGIIRAGLAYFWFRTLQPFNDGNEFVARNLLGLALAQDENLQHRPYKLDAILFKKQNEISELILAGQSLNGDITEWLKWFFTQLLLAINAGLVAQNKMRGHKLNDRQKKILSYLMSVPGDFAAVTNRECVELCQTSRESIKRDLSQLVSWDLLSKTEAGRSVCYLLKN